MSMRAVMQERAGWAGVLLCALVLASPQSGAAAAAPTLIGQPTEHFYHAAGNRVRVAWRLERTTVPEDGELLATLVVTGAENPGKVTRPDLRALPDFQSRFVISDVPPTESSGDVRFSYRLRPRSRTVSMVPALPFHYYNPSAPQGKKQFPLTTAKAVEITVTEPAPKPPPPAIPLDEPESLFETTTGADLLERSPFTPGIWLWVIVAIAGPAASVAWFLVWRKVYPDAARQSRVRRSRAARRAMDAIQRAGTSPDPAAAISTALLSYLRARYPFPPGAVTPPEIAAGLRELGAGPDLAHAAMLCFRNCDAARFAPSPGDTERLAADAAALIGRMEQA
jgi:hypothetical protein